MKRREALLTLASTGPCLGTGTRVGASPIAFDYESPYEKVDWSCWEIVHSMSHQHQGMTDSSRELFRAMGYGHFAFSNYYPSAPTSLPDAFREANPGVSWSPNAEQHSFLDSGLHFNSLGSRLATGYGSSLSSYERSKAPIRHRFEKLNRFDELRPWEGVYRLDIRLEHPDGTGKGSVATLSLGGARACQRQEGFADEGPVEGRALDPRNHTIYLRTQSDAIELSLEYDPMQIEVTQLRLMQGTNRPWREVFRATLDGESREGVTEGGLLYPDGGGITLNHPTGKAEDYCEMLDFDPRVLGIEVWNQLTSGFGSDRGFYSSMEDPPAHFYGLWDEILATGRRCWGFFVKDHNTYGRGRNVLFVPPLEGASVEEREAALLRSYRRGAFYGSVSAIAANDAGEVVPPYDRSELRFSRFRLRRNAIGQAESLEVAVTGNDVELRPNLQIRFVTEKGVAAVADQPEAEFPLTPVSPNEEAPLFVRVEVVSYPDTHLGGKPLTTSMVQNMGVAEIATLHDRHAKRGRTFFGNSAEMRTPIPIADLIFSQPIRRVSAEA